MLGLQLESRRLTQMVVEECFQKGILLGWTLHSNTLIRLAPPLIITDDELQYVLKIILDSVNKHN